MIPKPFKRSSVTLSTGAPRRSWVSVHASVLSTGDIVQDKGMVETHTRTGPLVKIEYVSGEVVQYTPADYVLAFTEGSSVGIGD